MNKEFGLNDVQAFFMPMQQNRTFIFIIAAYLLCSIYGILDVPLGGEEPRRAYLAVESVQEGDPLIMRHYGQLYFNKPPVHHIFNFLSIQSLGSGLISYRLTSFIAYLLMGLLLFRLLKSRSRQWAIYSLFIFMLSPDLMFYQTIYTGEIDGLFALLLFVQFTLFSKYLRKPLLFTLALAYLFGALAFLTKGLPAIFITAMGQVALFICAEKKVGLFIRHSLRSILPAIVLLVGYFGYFEWVTGHASVYLLNLIKESTSKSVEGFQWISFLHHIFLEFPGQLIKFTFPFIFIFLLWMYNKRTTAFTAVRKNKLLWFSLIYMLLNIWPYWLSSYSKSRYLIPFIPVFALLLGAVLSKMKFDKFNSPNRKGNRWPSILLPHLILPVGALVFIPDLPVYQNYLFAFSALVFYLAILIWVIRFQGDSDTVRGNIYTYAIVLISIKALLIYGILSEPLQRERKTRAIASFIYEYCKDHPVYITGSLEKQELLVQLGPYQWQEFKYKPPLMAYQVPLYYYEKTGKLMQYQREITQSGCFLRKVGIADKYFNPGEQGNSFVDPWTNSKIELLLKE